MSVDFGRRFEELLKQADEIEAAKVKNQHQIPGYEGFHVDQNRFLNWQVKARHLMSKVCGESSSHFQAFSKAENSELGESNLTVLLRLRAILEAASDDYKGGYLNRLRNLIQATVFESELEQAEELLNAGNLAAAAVVAGVVLETSLQQACLSKGLRIGKLDRMNSELGEAGVYNLLIQRQIAALADIRDHAAQGNVAAFGGPDVKQMIEQVRRISGDLLKP